MCGLVLCDVLELLVVCLISVFEYFVGVLCELWMCCVVVLVLVLEGWCVFVVCVEDEFGDDYFVSVIGEL